MESTADESEARVNHSVFLIQTVWKKRKIRRQLKELQKKYLTVHQLDCEQPPKGQIMVYHNSLSINSDEQTDLFLLKSVLKKYSAAVQFIDMVMFKFDFRLYIL